MGLSSTIFRLAFVVVIASVAYGQSETLRVDLKLRTGGALSGLVVDHNEHALVIVHDKTPYVFAWGELQGGSAYAIRRALLAFERGGEEGLFAEDHYQLGLFALSHDRRDLAAKEFRRADKLGRHYQPLIKEALDEYQRQRTESSTEWRMANGEWRMTNDELRIIEDEPPSLFAIQNSPFVIRDEHRAQVLDVYKTFGAKVQEVIGKSVVLIESDHFLIWTDWEPRCRDRLAYLCESMYTALCEQFDLDPAGNIFLAKCPVFCWRSKARFQKFARQFDGYDGTDAIGYTRSIEENGHVHIVLLRRGELEADFDRFACTLVHEGTHAFLHRLYTSRLIPHWVNEGYADLMAERVLGDRCHSGEKAALLARQFVRYDWPIGQLLLSVGPIDVHQYPLAHSVVAYLEGWGGKRLPGFIRDLKRGETVASALAANYDDLTIDQLEARWRSAHRRQGPSHDATR